MSAAPVSLPRPGRRKGTHSLGGVRTLDRATLLADRERVTAEPPSAARSANLRKLSRQIYSLQYRTLFRPE